MKFLNFEQYGILWRIRQHCVDFGFELFSLMYIIFQFFFFEADQERKRKREKKAVRKEII